jgi:Ni,Fe-hydrogenase III large subunit
MDFDAYLDRYMELVLTHFMFPVHPLINEPVDKKFELKVTLRKHMYEYNQRGVERIADLTKKMQDTLAVDAQISTYYLTLHTLPSLNENEKELVFSVCNKAYASTKAMLDEYRNQVFRRLGYA